MGIGPLLNLSLSIVCSNPFKWFFLWFQIVPWHESTYQYVPKDLSRNSAALSSLILCSANSSYLHLHGLQALPSQVKVTDHQVLPGFSLHAALEMSPDGTISRCWGNIQVRLVRFPFPRHHCPLLSYVQYFENHFHIFIVISELSFSSFYCISTGNRSSRIGNVNFQNTDYQQEKDASMTYYALTLHSI